MTRLSIRWRLTLWFAAFLAVILAAFCFSLFTLTRQQLYARMDATLQMEQEELALEMRLTKTEEAFQREAKDRFFEHDKFDFLVANKEGRVLFVSADLIPDELIGTRSNAGASSEFENRVLSKGGLCRVAKRAIPSPFGELTIWTVTSLAPLFGDLKSLVIMIGVLFPLALVTALVAGYFLAGRLLSPVKVIGQIANEITISNLHERIRILNPHDEIGILANTLNSLISRLERAVQEIRRFTADASHEIRTPLAALRLEAESTLRSSRSPEEYRRALAVVVEEATRLGRLADQLLNLSRQDAGTLEQVRESVRLDAVIQDVIDQLRPFAEARGVTLKCDRIEPCEILGNDIRLSQLFFNIIENAIKYTPQGGTVSLWGRISEPNGVFGIEDTGIGIAEEHVPRVFDRFYRVDQSRRSEGGGSGLGLSIAESAVHAHDGSIELCSQLGVGTRVFIRLPGVRPISGEVPTSLN
ncbi:MAG: ATP-binding protein [Planctomycetales bacterium]